MTDTKQRAEFIAYKNFIRFSYERHPWLEAVPFKYQKGILLEMCASGLGTAQSNPTSPILWGRMLGMKRLAEMLDLTEVDAEIDSLEGQMDFCLQELRPDRVRPGA